MKKAMISILLAGAFVLPCSNQLLLHAEDSVLAEENVIVVNNLKLQDDEYTYSIIGVEDTTVTSVTIPTEYNGKIIFADGKCFNDCPNLTEILVEEDNELYSSVDGVLFSGGTFLVRYPAGKSGEYVVPDGTKVIGNYAFSNCESLTSVTLPETVSDVQDYAFQNCRKLENIYGEISLATAQHTFEGCQQLKNLEISPNLQTSSNIDNLEIYACSNLEQLNFAENAILSGRIDIQENSQLKELHFPESSSAELIISRCNALEEITLPANAKSVSLSECPAIKKITIPDSSQGISYTLKDLYSLETLIVRQRNKSFYTLKEELAKAPNLTVYGYSGSPTEKNCRNYEIPFRALGDVVNDESVNVLDVIMLNRAILGKSTLDEKQQISADMNGNGTFEPDDALMIMKQIVGII